MTAPRKHTPGPWIVATSNSWRRIVREDGGSVCVPAIQRDGQADLYFVNGGEDGPDARLICAAPDLLTAAIALLDASNLTPGDCYDERGLPNANWGAIDRAKAAVSAAIAKATGGAR